MTAEERAVLETWSAQLDTLIQKQIAALWLRIEADIVATMPADGVPLAAVGDAWHAVSVESLILQERHRLEAWKENTLAEVRGLLERRSRELPAVPSAS